MADWTVVAAAAVTGLTGVASGTLGYLVAQQQARAQERQAAAQTRAAMRTKRGETYHSFLDIDRQLPSRLGAGLEIERGEMEEWLDPFNHCYNAVILLGSDAVSREARELFRGYVQLFNELTEGGTSWPDAAERRAAWEAHRGKLDEVRYRLIEAMRRDVLDDGRGRPTAPAARGATEL